MGLEVGQQLELHDRLHVGAIGYPPPDSLGVGLELCVAERVLEAGGVDRAAGNFEVDLDVDIGGAGMSPAAASAKQLGDEAAEHDELGASAVVVHDPYEGSLGGRPCSPGSFGVSHVPPPPGDAPPPLRP